MRIGLDSYSFHRLLGELRPGEADPGARLADGGPAVIGEARRLGLDGVSLETCFLDPPGRLDVEALRDAADGIELALAWGAPNGLELGARQPPLDDLLAWIGVAAGLGCRTMRIVVGGPALRPRVAAELRNVVEPLREAAASARGAGLRLALENHGDLTAAQVAELLERVGDDSIGVCFDAANAVRVGDDPVEAARLLASRVLMAHVKDCERAAADPVAGPRSVPFGEGVVPLEEVLEVLPSDVLLCVELGQLGPDADERELVRQGVAWLEEHRAASTAVEVA